jgi:hypothetical protein
LEKKYLILIYWILVVYTWLKTNNTASTRKEIVYIQNIIEFLVSSEGYIATANKIRKAGNIISEKIIEKPS